MPPCLHKEGDQAHLLAPPSYERTISSPLSLEVVKGGEQAKRSYSSYIIVLIAFFLGTFVCFVVFDQNAIAIPASLLALGTLQGLKESVPAQSASGHPQHPEECPSWFTQLRNDFEPWIEKGGIHLRDVEAARPIAAVRFQILNGSLYMEKFFDCFQSRLRYSLWGLLMLLRRYPAGVPDVDFMWDCGDDPKAFRSPNPTDPIPFLFNFCKLAHSIDVPFPDWSFWGWPELQVLPWANQSAKIVQGGLEAGPWPQRKNTAFWKGNVWVGYGLTQGLRRELVDCSHDPVWGVDAFWQDWGAEVANGFQYSRQWQQCGWRYRIYAEGNSWSVSSKYAFACGSTMLIIEPYFEAFYSRGMRFGENCLFVRRRPLCEALKEQIDWGNQHEEEAAMIADAGQRWVLEDLSMEHVYEYMLHLLQTYAELQTFEPVRSPGARLVTEGDILAEAAPHERSDYLLHGNVPSKPLCKLVEREVEAESVGGRRKLVDPSIVQRQKLGSREAIERKQLAARVEKVRMVAKSGAAVQLICAWLLGMLRYLFAVL